MLNIFYFLPDEMELRIYHAIDTALLLKVDIDKCYYCMNECKQSGMLYCPNMKVKPLR